MKKLILKDFVLNEISGVDRPAQPTATMSIIKRAQGKDEDSFKKKLMECIEAGSDNPLSKLITKAITEHNTEDKNMVKSDLEKVQEKVDSLTKSLETQKSDLEKQTFLASLNDEEKTFFKALHDPEADAFRALSEEERKKKMKLNKAADETLLVDGQSISKSEVGEGMFAVIKSQQAEISKNQAAIKVATEKALTDSFTKRATETYKHLTGKPEEIGAVLKVMAGASEGERKTFDAIFKAADEMTSKGFKPQGRFIKADPDGKSAVEQLDELAKKHAEVNKVQYAIAYSAIIEKNTDLYAQSLDEAQ